jgi:hypothetical protein
MRSLIVSSLVSLDGIHGDPQSWVGDHFDQQAAEESLAVLLDSDAMLMGRNTYDYFALRWSSPSGPYLERIYQMRKYVFSSTLTAADWNNTTIIPGDPLEAGQVRSHCQPQPVSKRRERFTGHRGQVGEVQHALTLRQLPIAVKLSQPHQTRHEKAFCVQGCGA